MNMTKENFYEIIKTKRIAFIGVGVSHNDLIRKYAKMGADITVLDKSTKEKIGELYNEFSALGVKFILGENYLKTLNDFYMVFRSPGVKYMLEEILKAKDEGVIITSEMEMFFQLCPCKTYAVTGSDGKTTTTTLISKILQKEFENTNKKVYLGGNIGKALLPILDQVTQEDIAVVELSSFQLISMTQSPDVAVVTNIEPNHLDAHKDMKEYVQAKKNIFYHQSPCSKLIINKDNQITKDFFGQQRGMGLYFSRISPNNCGTSLDDNGNLVYQKDNKTTILFNKEDIQIKGEHNIENYLAACCAVFEDVSSQSMKFVAKNFGGVEHRNEFIGEINGIKWFNDSIATSPTRTKAGLATFDEKIILIAGGYDKNIPFQPVAPSINDKVKILILMSDTAQKIKQAVENAENYNPSLIEIIMVNSMEEAVKTANEKAQAGDCVALNPASASFGLYKNFECRGNHFKDLVNALKNDK